MHRLGRCILRYSQTRFALLPLVQKLLVAAALLALCPLALCGDIDREDQLVWDFGEFVEAFSARDWATLARFVGPDSKAGLGGEMGFDGLMQVFGQDDICYEAMLRVLKMGCRKTGTGDDMRCVSPPQLGPDVVYLGARASFRFHKETGHWIAESLICGGD